MADNRIPEEWLSVIAFPDYEVSNLGRVRRSRPAFRSHWRDGSLHISVPAGFVLKQRVDERRRHTLSLYNNGIVKQVFVHQLVCTAFNGPRPTKNHQVAHWDGDSSNNIASNVRWATALENAADRDRHKTTVCGERKANAKLSNTIVIYVREQFLRGAAIRQLARDAGVSQQTMQRVVRGQTWKHVTSSSISE